MRLFFFTKKDMNTNSLDEALMRISEIKKERMVTLDKANDDYHIGRFKDAMKSFELDRSLYNEYHELMKKFNLKPMEK